MSLGVTPLADRLLKPEDLDAREPTAPLDVAICGACGLVQITETVPPDILFGGDYPYFSSVSQALLDHSRANALELIDRLELGPESQVIEIASNDGYLLRNFVERGIPVLGVDPAKDPAQKANEIGVFTINDFFSHEMAKRLRPADLLLANNVLAHVADLNGLVAGIAEVLKPDGIGVLEFPYVVDLVEHGEFDTIYHQHLCYFSVTALKVLFGRHGLTLQDVRRLSIHGGSLRIFVGRRPEVAPAVTELLEMERAKGFDLEDAYRTFAERVKTVTSQLVDEVRARKARGEHIVAYGAAAKGTTMLAFSGLGPDELDYVVDKNPYKHGRYMPGCRLEIVGTERLLDDRPDAVVLLTWNFAEEILKQQAEYLKRGGTFIIPIPELRVVSGS